MLLFCAFFADYLVRYFRSGLWRDAASRRAADGRAEKRLGLFFGFMSTAVLLILVRCSYRLAELRDGYRGGLIRDEGLFIGMEGV